MAQWNEYDVRLWKNPNSASATPAVIATQGDSDGIIINVTLLNDDGAIIAGGWYTGKSVYIECHSDEVIVRKAVYRSASTIKCVLPPEATNVNGLIQNCFIRIEEEQDDGSIISSASSQFSLIVNTGTYTKKNRRVYLEELEQTVQQVKDIMKDSEFKYTAELEDQFLSGEIVGVTTALPRTYMMTQAAVNNLGLAFESNVNTSMLGFDVYSTAEGTVEFYLSNYGGPSVPSTIEYKRIRVRLTVGWNTVPFVADLKANEQYALATRFVTSGLQLGRSSLGTIPWVSSYFQHLELLTPLLAYYPTTGGTGVAYISFYNIQVAGDLQTKMFLAQQEKKFYTISPNGPTDSEILWLRPRT